MLVYTAPDARRVRGGRGFPDLVLAGPRGVLFREVKTGTGRLTEAQWRWGGRILAAGGNWDTWRPMDLEDGRIQAQLAAIA